METMNSGITIERWRAMTQEERGDAIDGMTLEQSAAFVAELLRHCTTTREFAEVIVANSSMMGNGDEEAVGTVVGLVGILSDPAGRATVLGDVPCCIDERSRVEEAVVLLERYELVGSAIDAAAAANGSTDCDMGAAMFEFTRGHTASCFDADRFTCRTTAARKD
jgi:hypothetical protein